MNRNVVHREPAIARDHHHTFDHGLIIEGAGLRGHSHLGARTILAHRLDNAVLERGHAIERERAAYRDHEVDEQHAARLAGAQPLDRHNAGNSRQLCGNFARGARPGRYR